jgi:hypothetical protein
MVSRTLTLLLTGLFLTLAACSGDRPDTPQAQVRDVIESMQTAAEDRSTGGVMRHVSGRYTDEDGRSREDLRDRLRIYFLQRNSLELSVSIESIEVITPVRVEARLRVSMAGSAAQRARALSGIGDRPMYFTLSFDHEEDGDWRVVRAEWSRDGS